MALNPNPESSLGATLAYELAGTSAFTTLTEVMDDLDFDGFDTTVIPIKPVAQTVLTKAPGRIDPGTFTFSVYWVMANAGLVELFALAAARTICAWQLQLPDGSSAGSGSTATFSGFISNVKPGNVSGEDAPTVGFTIAISGAVSVTAGS